MPRNASAAWTVMVTGATHGIGRQTAEALARRGADVVLVCRDPALGERAQREIGSSCGGRRPLVIAADLSSQDSIRRAAAEFLATGRPLHVLVNNAGTFELSRRVSADGIEMTLAVNLVAPFLLTSLLLPRLRECAPARIVNVGSGMQGGALNFADLQFERRPYVMTSAYTQSKLALLTYTIELARRLRGKGVTANVANPGFVRSNIGNRGPLRLIWPLLRPWQVSPQVGARTSVLLAADPDLEGVTGGYFVHEAPAHFNPVAADREVGRRLWALLEALTGTGRSAAA